MIRPQYVYLAVDFKFSNGESKPKFFVVFHADEDNVLLFSLTTSRAKLPADVDADDVEGCVQFADNRGYAHAFIWKKDGVIGTNGYAPSKRAYVQLEFRAHLQEISATSITEVATNRIVEKCKLTDTVFCDLLRCLLLSKFIKKKHKMAIQAKVAELSRT